MISMTSSHVKKQPKNIILQLRQREVDNVWNVRRNCQIVKALVCQETSTFKKVWERTSRSPIAYEGNRIYFDNYKSVYIGHGSNGRPELLYRLPSCPNKHKIEDALVCQFPLDRLPLKNKGYKGHLLALTRDNWLTRHDLNTGAILQEVFLSQRYKYRHLGWQGEGGTVVVRSIHSKLSAMARTAGIIQPLLMVLTVFSIFPLELVAVMEIQKEIFGKDISDAMISQGSLIIMHQGGTVRLYSFDRIVQENTIVHAKLGETYNGTSGIVGSHPTGIPCTVKLKETPPVLFEVRCHEHNLQMGGFPWHYLFVPHRNMGVFQVHRVENKKQASNGVIDMDLSSLEPDKAVFHADESGRILHISGNYLRVLKLHSDNSTSEVKECFTITPTNAEGNNPATLSAQGEDNSWTLSSSGRIIKRRRYDSSVRPTLECIKDVDYENELDLLVITTVTDIRDDATHTASVCLYDNKTGILIKQIPLEEAWDETFEHTISFDLDTCVHIYKTGSSKFHCTVYRLDRTVPHELDKSKSKPDTSGKKRPRRNSRRIANVADGGLG